MPPEEAKVRLDEYRDQLAGERTTEDEAIAAGYRAAARGLPIIRLPEVISAGGWFDDGLPKLAIARADTTTCHVQIPWPEHRTGPYEVVFTDQPAFWNTVRAAHVGRHGIRVALSEAPVTTGKHRRSGQTVVPIIPPRFRPSRRRLHHRHILWEVEKWDRTPPVDPALLRHIRGDLWAVLAVWDLTELERAVLSART